MKNPRKLYLIQDIYDKDVYFARNSEGFFARFKKLSDRWIIYFYKDRYSIEKTTLTESLAIIENRFRKWFLSRNK